MKPLGPTLLEVLNCGFHKIKGERESKILIRREQERYDNKAISPTISGPYIPFLYALNSLVTREQYSTTLLYF